MPSDCENQQCVLTPGREAAPAALPLLRSTLLSQDLDIMVMVNTAASVATNMDLVDIKYFNRPNYMSEVKCFLMILLQSQFWSYDVM